MPEQQKRTYKVKKTVAGGPQKNFRKWDEWDVGDYVIGKFVGIWVDNRYRNNNLLVEVEEANFQDKKLAKKLVGQTLVLNSTGMIKKSLGNGDFAEGDILQATYNGKGAMPSGPYKGEDAHLTQIDVMEDEDSDYNEADIDDENEEEMTNEELDSAMEEESEEDDEELDL